MVRRAAVIGVTAILASSLLVSPASAAPTRVRLDADIDCVDGGGAAVRFTVENRGTSPVRIDPDFHLRLEPVGPGGRRPGVIAFVFPAPGFDRIPAGEERVFLVDLGIPIRDDPGVDLSGERLLLESQVWLRGRDRPVERTFAAPGC